MSWHVHLIVKSPPKFTKKKNVQIPGFNNILDHVGSIWQSGKLLIYRVEKFNDNVNFFFDNVA